MSGSGGGMKDLFRMLGSILGLAMIGFGGYWSVKLFFMILKILEAPGNILPLVKEWGALLKLESFKIATPRGTINFDFKWIAVSFLGTGAFLLSSISIRLVLAGTTLLSSMVTDIATVKKMILRAMRSGVNKSGADQISGK